MQADARMLLRQAIDLYIIGRYQEAADRLRSLVEGKQLKDRADQKEALRAYGISLYLCGGISGAERAFRELLRLEPTARLDPSFVRPEVVRFFEGVRFRYQAELDEVVRQRGPQGEVMLNLIPPWGQFQNKHPRKAYLLLGGEITLAAVSLSTGLLLYSWRGETREFPGHENAYTPLAAMNYVSFGMLVGLLAYGIIDGMYYYYRAPSGTL